MVKKLSILLAIVACHLGLLAATYSVSTLPNVQVQDHSKHLVNPDGIVSPAVAQQIDSLLLDIRRQASAEVVAVIVDDIDPADIDSFATDLFNAWGIGKSDKNNGILLVVAKDQRRYAIRTGYGAEGILPDILAGRIQRELMRPRFREGDYDGGMLQAVNALHTITTDPQAREELMSGQADNYDDDDDAFFWQAYVWLSAFVAVCMLIWLISLLAKERGKSDYDKYIATYTPMVVMLASGFLFLGMPLAVALVLYLMRYHWRNHKRRCPQCSAMMHKLGEEEDNKYLTMAQDTEERIRSVDYDVWLCPECGETDIYAFKDRTGAYSDCPYCGACALKTTGYRILRQPTQRAEGICEKDHECVHCHKRYSQQYTLPKVDSGIVVMPLGGGRGGGFGGGFGGGSFGGGFGGGMTGGGGASGGW